MYWFWGFIFFLMAQQTGIAQLKVGGLVRTNNDLAIEGVMVTLMEEDTVSILDFTTTNSMGRWEIKLPKKGTYCLSIGYLGYGTLYKCFTTNASFDTLISVLEEKPLEIPLTSVYASKLAIMQKNDTVFYDIKQFMNGNEDKLGDILSKLPGIEYGKDGSIKYNGKRVDNLMLEGRNIFSNMHKAMAEGVNAQDVKTVKIINNVENNGQNNATAIDLELNDKNKRRWNGNVSLGLGKDWRYRGGVNLYQAHSKSGTTVFFRTDGSGQSLLTMADYIGLQPSMEKFFSNMIYNPSGLDEFNEIQIPTNGLIRNNDQFLNVNHERSLGNGKRLNASLSVINLNRETSNQFLQLFYPSGAIYEGKTNVNKSVKSIVGNVGYKANNLDVLVPVTIKQAQTDDLKTGNYNLNPFNSLQQLTSNLLSISPEINKRWQKNDSIRFRITLKPNFINENKTINIQGLNKLFDTDLNLITATQHKEVLGSELTLTNSRTLRYGSFSNQLMAYIEHQKSSQIMVELNKATTNTMTDKGLKYLSYLTLKKDKEHLQILGHLGFLYRQKASETAFMPLIDLSLIYGRTLQPNCKLAISAIVKTEAVPFSQTVDYLLIIDQQNASIGNLPIGQYGTTWSTPIILNIKNEIGHSLFVNITPFYALNKIGTEIQVEEAYLRSKSWIMPSVHGITSHLNYMKTFSKLQTRTNIKCNTNLGNGFLKTNNEITPTSYLTFAPSIYIASDIIKNMTFSVGYDLSLNYQKNTLITNQSIQHGFSLEAKQRVLSSLVVEAKLGYVHLSNGTFVNQLWYLDTAVKYQVGKFYFFVKGENLFNLSPRIQKGIELTGISTTQTSFSTYPGVLLLGIEYKL